MENNRPIGVFDSGMGGLTVLAELVRALPEENFIYLGDTARVPWGPKSPRVIQKYAGQVADYLMAKDIKYLVIACNTATAHAGLDLQRRLSVPVRGVIEPGVAALLDKTDAGRVGVIGTRSTIKSGAYEKEIRARDETIRVFSRACPLFVPMVEEGWLDKKITSLVIQEYLAEMVREEVDTLVLGCTHYPLLKSAIRAEFPGLTLIDSSVETARAVMHELDSLEIRRSPESPGGEVRVLLTDLTEQIENMERLFLGLSFRSLEEVRLVEDL